MNSSLMKKKEEESFVDCLLEFDEPEKKKIHDELQKIIFHRDEHGAEWSPPLNEAEYKAFKKIIFYCKCEPLADCPRLRWIEEVKENISVKRKIENLLLSQKLIKKEKNFFVFDRESLKNMTPDEIEDLLVFISKLIDNMIYGDRKKNLRTIKDIFKRENYREDYISTQRLGIDSKKIEEPIGYLKTFSKKPLLSLSEEEKDLFSSIPLRNSERFLLNEYSCHPFLLMVIQKAILKKRQMIDYLDEWQIIYNLTAVSDKRARFDLFDRGRRISFEKIRKFNWPTISVILKGLDDVFLDENLITEVEKNEVRKHASDLLKRELKVDLISYLNDCLKQKKNISGFGINNPNGDSQSRRRLWISFSLLIILSLIMLLIRLTYSFFSSFSEWLKIKNFKKQAIGNVFV